MNSEPEQHVDLDAYFSRIGWVGNPRPTAKVLEELHLAHATHIPFENLDILLGRPINLDLESLQGKLVYGRRGGYCFEQNTLFAAVLEQLGYHVTRLAARVRYNATRVLPRTHMLLKVDGEGASWLADVGFGGGGILTPIHLTADQNSLQFSWTYRLIREEDAWVLQSLQGDGWSDLYAFTEEPQYPVDFEMANYYVSTHPKSIFVQLLLAQLPTPEARYILRNRELTILREGGVETAALDGEEALLRVLADCFHLRFAAGTRFRFQDVYQP
jgi:N-hydroxyarylamine O-acetyltransferase